MGCCACVTREFEGRQTPATFYKRLMGPDGLVGLQPRNMPFFATKPNLQLLAKECISRIIFNPVPSFLPSPATLGQSSTARLIVSPLPSSFQGGRPRPAKQTNSLAPIFSLLLGHRFEIRSLARARLVTHSTFGSRRRSRGRPRPRPRPRCQCL